MNSLAMEILSKYPDAVACNIFDALRKAYKAGNRAHNRYYVEANSFTQTLRAAGVVANDGCYLTEKGIRLAAHLCS